MRSAATLIVAGLMSYTGGCGSRTGLDEPIAPVPDAVDAAAARASSDAGADATSPSLPFCAFHAGPVASCVETPGAGPIQRCAGTFSLCAETGGVWGCCTGAGPFNGPGGSCLFAATAGCPP
jgi:hypothetical protein